MTRPGLAFALVVPRSRRWNTGCAGRSSDDARVDPSPTMYRLVRPHSTELVVKKSRFVTCAAPVSSAKAALRFLEDVREKDASHNCWAYKLQNESKSSDDGEPSGTAGRPILSAIDNLNFVDVVVVVTRYFGGIKLGAGGLIRAYSSAAVDCLRSGEAEAEIPSRCLRVAVEMAYVGELYRQQNLFGCESLSTFTDGDGLRTGAVMRVELDRADAFADAIQEATRGTASIEIVEQQV